MYIMKVMRVGRVVAEEKDDLFERIISRSENTVVWFGKRIGLFRILVKLPAIVNIYSTLLMIISLLLQYNNLNY